MERKSTWRDLVGANPTFLTLGSSRKPHRVEPLERGAFQSSVEEAESGDIDPRSHYRPWNKQGPFRGTALEPTARCRRVSARNLAPNRRRLKRSSPSSARWRIPPRGPGGWSRSRDMAVTGWSSTGIGRHGYRTSNKNPGRIPGGRGGSGAYKVNLANGGQASSTSLTRTISSTNFTCAPLKRAAEHLSPCCPGRPAKRKSSCISGTQ